MDLRIEQNLARQVRTQAATLRRVRAERDAALAEVARLRAGLPGLRREHMFLKCVANTTCDCGADAHNARIDAVLQGDPQ